MPVHLPSRASLKSRSPCLPCGPCARSSALALLELNLQSCFRCPSPQAFAEVLSNNEVWAADMAETYRLLDIDPNSVVGLEDYLQVRARAAMY